MDSCVVENLVFQHVEQGAFLWLLRDRAVISPHYSRKDLLKLDGRIEANIDGLSIASDEGWEFCKEAMGAGEAGGVFVAAVLALESGNKEWLTAVLEAVKANPDSFAGLVGAFEWLPWHVVEPYATRWLTDGFPVWRYAAVSACAAHGHDPGKTLIDALADSEPLLSARALKAVGELGRRDLLQVLQRSMTAEDDYCRYCAAWSAALLGDADAAAMLKPFAALEIPWAEEAVTMAIRCMGPSTNPAWLHELSQDPATARLAIIGAGAFGDPVMVPWLLKQMTIPEQARVAGEAFTMITGVDLALADLDGDRPEGFESGPTENPEDEDVEMDPDENLPWPNPALVTKWWNMHGNRFRSGTRHLLGEPITSGQLQQVLKTGRQRQRYAAALELAMMNPGRHLFNIRAPGFRQNQLLGLK